MDQTGVQVLTNGFEHLPQEEQNLQLYDMEDKVSQGSKQYKRRCCTRISNLVNVALLIFLCVPKTLAGDIKYSIDVKGSPCKGVNCRKCKLTVNASVGALKHTEGNDCRRYKFHTGYHNCTANPNWGCIGKCMNCSGACWNYSSMVENLGKQSPCTEDIDTIKCCTLLHMRPENHCRNRGKLFCEDHRQEPKCTCPVGWTGDTCETRMNETVTCKCFKTDITWNSFCGKNDMYNCTDDDRPKNWKKCRHNIERVTFSRCVCKKSEVHHSTKFLPECSQEILQPWVTSATSTNVPIVVLSGPDTIMVKPSNQAFLHCEVYGNPKPSVSWTKNGSPLRSRSRYKTFSNGTLLVRSATPGDADSYTCRADNGVSSPVERTIKLSLREMLVARIENLNGKVVEGGQILLTCVGKGYPEPAITWEKAGRALVSGGNVFISSNGGLTIRDATSGDTGTYTCIIANTDEKIEKSTSVQVEPKDKCEDKTSLIKCQEIVSARLCGYTMYYNICCNSCRRFVKGE
ncbi:uncharacterized protein LOC127874886 [Dreissena polymorpha]|uniref:Uncharacterized protein n=1 Tax=Dreissena polymorpha TaxID=45954 RepID=A0A9D4KYQ5_DREPO|nr:uncharacterized protein LOC127874886 [Dreissena polymorpha]KAH3848603.1 hypothetical protein DPMN_090982 [Dreissena polymorpha]